MPRRIALALALAAALAALLVVLVRREDREERAERADARLVVFDERSIRSFVLTTKEGPARFERGGKGWRMIAPVEDSADPAAVETLLGALRRVRVERALSDPEALSSYGLDPPVASLELFGEDAVPRVDLGEPDPTGEGLFARREGRAGVLVLGLPEAFVLRDPSPARLRDATLLGLLANEVTKVVLRAAGESLSLAREGDGWWIVEPHRRPASDAAVGTLLSALEATSVRVLDDRADPGDPELGLGPAAIRISLETPGERREIVLGAIGADGLRSALRDDRRTVLRVEGGAGADLAPEPAAFVDGKPTKANRYRVVAFTDDGPKGAVRATRSGADAWTDGEGAPLPEDAVLGFLARLLEAPVAEYLPRAEEESVVRTLTFRLESGTEERIEVLADGLVRKESLPGTTIRLQARLPEPIRRADQ